MCGARKPRLTDTENVQGSSGVSDRRGAERDARRGQRIVRPERRAVDQRAVGRAAPRSDAPPNAQRADQPDTIGHGVERGLGEHATLREGRAVRHARDGEP